MTLCRTLGSFCLEKADSAKGVNQYRKARRLSDWAYPFLETELESAVQLESEELYILDASDEPVRAGLKLAHLVSLRPSPGSVENACYFYSRLDGGEAEYVSHHFEEAARIQVHDPDLLSLLRRLNPTD